MLNPRSLAPKSRKTPLLEFGASDPGFSNLGVRVLQSHAYLPTPAPPPRQQRQISPAAPIYLEFYPLSPKQALALCLNYSKDSGLPVR